MTSLSPKHTTTNAYYPEFSAPDKDDGHTSHTENLSDETPSEEECPLPTSATVSTNDENSNSDEKKPARPSPAPPKPPVSWSNSEDNSTYISEKEQTQTLEVSLTESTSFNEKSTQKDHNLTYSPSPPSSHQNTARRKLLSRTRSSRYSG